MSRARSAGTSSRPQSKLSATASSMPSRSAMSRGNMRRARAQPALGTCSEQRPQARQAGARGPGDRRQGGARRHVELAHVDRRRDVDVIEAEVIEITQQDRQGQYPRHVRGGLFGQRARLIDERPVVVTTERVGAIDEALVAKVVGGQGHVPRKETIVEIRQVRHGSFGRTTNAATFVDVRANRQPVRARCRGHQLPEPRGARRRDGSRLAPALDEDHSKQFGRQVALGERLRDDVSVEPALA